MKTIGIFKAWADTQRGNAGNIKHRRFGQRSFIRRCVTDQECRQFIIDLRKKGYTAI
jgi:hypothetical protein